MRLPLDEDMQSKRLVALLCETGHDAETISGAGYTGERDAAVLELASRSGRVLITRNAMDYFLLHEAGKSHFGSLVEYRDPDGSKNMSRQEVATAIRKIEPIGWNVVGQFASLHAWR